MANNDDTTLHPEKGGKQKFSSDLSYVYVIQDDNGLIKIGHSNNPTRRLKQIQRACGFNIVHRHFSPPCYNAEQVENVLQAEFGDRLKQEEYVERATFEEVCEALNRKMFQIELSTAPEHNLLSFLFKTHSIRAILDEKGKVWFVAKDVCQALDISWRGNDTLVKIPVEWRMVRNFRTTLENQHGDYGEVEKEVIFINSPAVYKLAFRSNKKEADNFTNWVAEEVLPKLQQQGFYSLYGEVNPSIQGMIKQVTEAVSEKIAAALGPLARDPVVLVETQNAIVKKVLVSFQVKFSLDVTEV